jgi:hypothetical protein
MSVLRGRQLLDHLQQAGVVPPNVRRAVIDASFDHVVSVYYECFGDPRLLRVDALEPLKDAVALHVEDLADT